MQKKQLKKIPLKKFKQIYVFGLKQREQLFLITEKFTTFARHHSKTFLGA